MQDLTNSINDVSNIYNEVEPIIDKMVNDKFLVLDRLMEDIDEKVARASDISVQLVESYFVKLSSVLYTVSSEVEKFSIYDSSAKINFKQQFNTAYLSQSEIKDSSGKQFTASKLTALAENESMLEALTNDLFNKAYKIMKTKVDCAQTMISTLSKILSHKISEMQMTGVTIDNKRILNE